jgi:hypothetical protein
MVNPNRFYTYAYLREDRTPYYIGKGSGNRLYKRGKKQFKPPVDKSRIIFLKQNLTEEEAFKHEIYMIAVFGRKDLGTGILHNRTDGGEGLSGVIRSEEWRIKIRESKKGNSPSEETRKKLKEVRTGKKHSEETKRKMSESRTGIPSSEETKRKLREIRKNQVLSMETITKLSEAGKKGSNKNKKNKVGIFSLSKEELSENGKKANSQKWMCLETGFVSNSGGLSHYQKARNIDTSKRKRIE